MICLDRSAVKLSFLVLASFLLQVVPVPGQDLVWARQMGGSPPPNYVPGTPGMWASGVAVDGSGNVYTTGYFTGTVGTVDFDPGAGVFNLTSTGRSDIFVSKLDSAGNFVWVRQMGGSAAGNDVAVDGSGNVYTTGSFSGTADFDPGAGVFNLTSAGGPVFVSKLDSAGNFVWARQMGGTSSAVGNDMAVDGSGDV